MMSGSSLMSGQVAVEIFFVISGFYMSLILRTKYQYRPGTFFLNRALRLYPAYALVLLMTWAWTAVIWLYLGHLPASGTSDAYAAMSSWQSAAITFSNLTMIGQDVLRLLYYKIGSGFYFMHASPFDTSGAYVGDSADGAKWVGEFQKIGQAWSLGIEVWFYALAPMLVRLRARSLLAIAILSFGLRGAMRTGDATSFFAYFFFPANLGFFLIGILLDRWTKALSMPRSAAQIALPLAFSYSIICSTAFPASDWLQYALILLIPSLFTLTKKSHWDGEIGNLSYPVYLCHGLVIGTLTTVHVRSALIAIVATILLSAAIYRLLECPIDTYRQEIVRRSKEAAHVPA
jgi:peptidoglycan/LPS O-acetylase OafA/YrhL